MKIIIIFPMEIHSKFPIDNQQEKYRYDQLHQVWQSNYKIYRAVIIYVPDQQTFLIQLAHQ